MTNIKLGKQNIPERDILREKNDCTVVALSQSLSISYLEAYGMMIACGRRKGKGANCFELYNSVAISKLPRPNMTVENFVKGVINFGNWIVQVRGHVFSIINGEIRDTGYVESNLKRHVIQAWRMK